jgi:hypothetical protein
MYHTHIQTYTDPNSIAKANELVVPRQRMSELCVHINNEYRVPEMATHNPNPYSTSHRIIQTLRMYQELCITGGVG